jgi:hypothetical protein
MMLAKARIVNYDHNCSFIVLPTVITIVNYNHHLFIVLAPGLLTFTKNMKLIKKLKADLIIFLRCVIYNNKGIKYVKT